MAGEGCDAGTRGARTLVTSAHWTQPDPATLGWGVGNFSGAAGVNREKFPSAGGGSNRGWAWVATEEETGLAARLARFAQGEGDGGARFFLPAPWI